MSRENGDQESPPHYLNLHNVNLPLSHPPAVYDINSAINGSVHDPECQAIEELSYGSQGNDMKSYSYIMGSIQHTNANSTQPGTFVLPDKSHMHLASCYNQPLQPITTMQNMDMINQAVYCSTQPPPPGFYPPEYLPTDYYSDPYWISQDPLANQYVTENITATKDTIRLSPIKFCSNCFTTETPSWRRCSEGRNLLCNACGL
ncbi:hypothetical protein BGW37DRAFT_249908 [Umbelopsis sp. PMI_123]|nr:hypothetical protein BGW37DRAFT_249908 [Umbelopsis sp. PMI_123]